MSLLTHPLLSLSIVPEIDNVHFCVRKNHRVNKSIWCNQLRFGSDLKYICNLILHTGFGLNYNCINEVYQNERSIVGTCKERFCEPYPHWLRRLIMESQPESNVTSLLWGEVLWTLSTLTEEVDNGIPAMKQFGITFMRRGFVNPIHTDWGGS